MPERAKSLPSSRMVWSMSPENELSLRRRVSSAISSFVTTRSGTRSEMPVIFMGKYRLRFGVTLRFSLVFEQYSRVFYSTDFFRGAVDLVDVHNRINRLFTRRKKLKTEAPTMANPLLASYAVLLDQLFLLEYNGSLLFKKH